ncbi:MAG: GtrA family protein [Sphingorhabdus sp.]
MIKLIVGMRANTYIRYFVVSLGALAVDVGIFLTLLSGGVASVAASAAGYTVGILAHWILSSRKVFRDRVSERGTTARTQQKAMFVMSALLGLLATIAIVGGGNAIGLDPRISKLVAIGVSFQLTYFLRNLVIFRNPQIG